MNWIKQEIDFLRANYKTLPREELEIALNRSWKAIKSKSQSLGLERDTGYRKEWSSEEIEIIKLRFPFEKTAKIAKDLGCTYSQVQKKAKDLNLEKSKVFNAKVRKETTENLLNGGKKHRFKKGNIPYNKGKKIDVGGRSVETRFKKGHLPHNTKKNGSISIRNDRRGIPYAFIRVSLGKWEHLHRYIWETTYGPISKGTVIRFKDGNTLNCDLENLEAINRGEHMERNTIHRFPPELKQAIRRLSKLKRIIKKKENEKSVIRS